MGGVCVIPCKSLTDCDFDYTACVGGFCQVQACAANGHEESCTFGLDGGGTCVDTGEGAWACRENGTATTSCDAVAAPSSTSIICGAGQDCEPLDDGGAGCQQLCNPTAASGCPAGQGCAASDVGGDPTAGYCTPVSDGGCGLIDPSQTEGASCASAVNCGCPQICVGPADGGAVCAYPCTTTADCQEPFEVCADGACSTDPCGPGGAPDGGDLGPANGPCNVTGTGDGTCFGQVFQGLFGPEVIYACYAAGTSTAACDPNGTRSDPASLCKQGYGCFASGDAGTCVPLCNSTELTSGLGCATGLGCYEYASSANDTAAGECLPQGDGGCFDDLPPASTELGTCATNADCACPQSCVNDPNFGLTCETPCQSTGDCPTIDTSCQTNLCQYDFCDQGPKGAVSGTYGEPCNAAGTGDGICVAISGTNASGNPISLGLCEQAGDAGTGAACGFTRGGPLCAVSDVCEPNASGNDVCAVACNPTADAGACASPNVCLRSDPTNTAGGYCNPCIASGGACYANGDCCSQDCNANNGACN